MLPRGALATLLLLALVSPSLPARQEPEPPLDLGVREDVFVSLRQVDVLALDKDGRPVPDLRKEEFRLEEEGRAVEIRTFDPPEAAARTVAEDAPGPAAPASPGQPVPELPAPPAPGVSPRWVVIFFEARTLSYQGRVRTGRALAHFVKTLEPEDRVAVMIGEEDLRVAVPFAVGREAVLAHLEDPGGLTATQRDLERRLRELQETVEGCRDARNMSTCARQAVDNFLTETSRETEDCLEQLEALIRALAAIPDRKILVYVSEGIILDPGDVALATIEHAIGQHGYNLMNLKSSIQRDYRYRMDLIYRLATEGRIGFYPVNTIRKMSDDLFSAEKRMDYEPENFAQARTDPFEASWQQSFGLHRSLARATAGVPTFSRDPVGLLGPVTGTQAGVYTLGYPVPARGGDRRKVQIKTSRKGVRLYYLDSYRWVPSGATRVQGSLTVDTSGFDAGRGLVRATLRVPGGDFKVAPDSAPPTVVAALFFRLEDVAGRAIQNHFEVIAFPRKEGGGEMSRPFAVKVPRGDYRLRAEIRDIHGNAWGSFTEPFSVSSGAGGPAVPAGGGAEP